MTKLKNITNTSVTLQMFNTPDPVVNNIPVDAVITFQPGQVVEESTITVVNPQSSSYNADIVNDLISSGVLTIICL